MGKRVAATTIPEANHVYSTPTPARGSIRKRKRSALNAANTASKVLRLSGAAASHYWHENDDEDSSSNDAAPPPRNLGRNNESSSTKHANNSSILLNTSLNATHNFDTSINESPKPVYTLRPSVVNGTVLHDLTQKSWRLGRPIGKGNFGEIFLASDNISVPVTNENAKFVVKIEPHSNGPLFVEIHCLMSTAKKANDDERKQSAVTLSNIPPSGIPDYIASGSHYFGDARYRFLVLQRFDRDLHSLIKNCRVSQKSVLTLAIHIVNVLEKLHDKGYCHNDVKAQNLMISKCKYYKKQQQEHDETNGRGKNGATLIKGKYTDHEDEKQQTTDSGNSSEQEELNDEDTRDIDYGTRSEKDRKYKKYNEEDYEDFDDGSTSHSNNSNSMDIYETPINKNRKRRIRGSAVEFSGSNPVRSCRRQQRNSIYEEMVKSHYLRPAKRISYSEFFNEDASSVKGDTSEIHLMSSDDESEEFIPRTVRRTASKSLSSTCEKRLTRRQEKIATKQQHLHTTPVVAAPRFVAVEEERIFLIDFGLASKFMDNGAHRPFVMDQRRAHDGTLEFTSRDAHMGAHSRRSDLECLGYNLIFWSQGYLPWKEAATQQQQEKVHRAKEYLMTDVREMLKQIYGKQVPKFLGEFLHYVGQLAYHERPDYARCRRIFEREYHQMNYTPAEIMLDSLEIGHTCVRFKEEIENIKDIFEMNKSSLSIMKNMPVGTPFHERTLSNRVSPKNLRSKSDKKETKKKKFSWAEILSQDPDQIARERAEKEFDREEELSDTQQPAARKYEGKPTYAILEVQQRMKMNGRTATEEDEQIDEEQEDEREDENSEDEDAQEEVEECEDEEAEEEDEEDEGDDNDGENENEDDTDNEEADEGEEENNSSEEENADSDVTETSEAMPRTKRRTRRTTREVTNNSVRKTSTPRCKNKSKKDIECKNDKVEFTQTRTRRSAAKLKTDNEAKCGGATLKRSGRKIGTISNAAAAASAAGEIEHKTARYRHIDTNSGCNKRGGGLNGKPSERRTRRCLIKTDADELSVAGEDSNSNFSPDVRNLFNVWKKINNESIYFRGSNAAATAAAKHCKK